jgi:hypothetical protein
MLSQTSKREKNFQARPWPRPVLVAFLTAALFLGGCSCRSRSQPAPSPTPQPSPEVELRPFTPDMPVVSLYPREDGNALILRIEGVSQYQVIEAKVRYQTGEGKLQGFLKTLKPEGKDFVEGEGIFGTCSRGVCRYDVGVEEGSVELIFKDLEGNESLWKSGFRLYGAGTEEELKSADGKLSLTLPGANVTVIHSLLGIPGGEVNVYQEYGYGIFPPFGQGEGEAEFKFFNLSDEFEDLKIAFWDGEEWQFPEVVREKEALTISGEFSGNFIVLSKSPS